MAVGKTTVTRFNRKATYQGRDVKRTVVTRKAKPGITPRAGRTMKPMRSGR